VDNQPYPFINTIPLLTIIMLYHVITHQIMKTPVQFETYFINLASTDPEQLANPIM